MAGKNFGKLVISKFWRMLNTCIMARGKLWQISFANSLNWSVFNDALTHDR